MNHSHKSKSDPGFLSTLSSLQFGLVVLVIFVFVAITGTLIPQGYPFDFYRERYGSVILFLIRIFRFDSTYSSPLFIGLLGLFGLNLVLCSLVKFPSILKKTFMPDLTPGAERLSHLPIHASVSATSLEEILKTFDTAGFSINRVSDNRLFCEKGRFGYLGVFAVHLSIMIFLIGGVISLITGIRGSIALQKGESISMVALSEEKIILLGFEITLENFDVQFYKDFPSRPKSYTSSVTVKLPDGEKIKKDIRVNHPLVLNNFTIYQSDYGPLDEPQPAPAGNDTASVAVSLKGVPDKTLPITVMDMVLGKEYAVPGFGDSITVRLAELHRDFGSGNMPSSPAVKIDVIVNKKQQWSVYAFKNFPGLNMPMHQELNLVFSMRDIKTVGGEFEQRDEYYSVLGVVRDRGIPVMGAGAVLMMAGLFLSFYMRPKRVWVLKENEEVVIGAMVKGDPDPFRKFILQMVKTIEKRNQ